MEMYLLRWFLLFDIIFCCFISVDLISQYPIILIISYDAFRFDYLSKGMSPVASQLRDRGTFAEFIDNVFVTKTFPNHHSLATGVYPEFHGVLGNSVYDNKYKRQLNYSYEFWHYSDEILPIWIANEKKGEGRHSGIMMWPGNEYEYGGIRPTHQRAWSYNITWDQRVNEVVKWILDPEKPANLILLYIEEPDYHGHSFGADSPKLLQELKVLDNITNYILEKLNESNLNSHVNLFFLADHGMLSVTKKDVIDLRNIVPSDLYDKYEGSPALHIYPKPGKANEVYIALKNAVSNGAPFHVYKKSDIPDHWHFKNNRRAPPLLAVADPPHVFHDFYPYIEDLQKRWNFTADDDTPFGIHGYDNQVKLMKPYFLAVGPDIKPNFKIEPFRTIDLFSLWAHMSGFPEYARKTNGSFTIVSKMLKDPEKPLITLMTGGEVFEITSQTPVVVTTWKFLNATEKAWEILSERKGTALDAVEAGCTVCECEQCDLTVGYGGSPDESGETTLDAMIMDGTTMNVGAVGGLRGIRNAAGVARKVLDNTEHSFLVGGLATDFAKMMGFPVENLTTSNSSEMHRKWVENKCQPNFRKNVVPDPRKSCGPYKPIDAFLLADREMFGFGEGNHDTIGMVAIDSDFRMASGTSTNGARYKIPGRVGDSPIAGAGSYVDDDVGGAAATGDGDVMMRFLPAFLAVEEMRRGRSAEAAAQVAVKRISAKYPEFRGAVVALRKDGTFGAACSGMEHFPFYVGSQAVGGVRLLYKKCL